MGKTPKSNHGNERRRPYNYPRNVPQAQISGTESRNYGYPPGNVPRRIPVYHSVPFQGVGVPIQSQSFRFGPGRGFRGRLRGINKPLLGRQRRPDQRNKRVLASPYRRSAKKNMQAQVEEQETVQEKTQEEDESQGISNGPESGPHTKEISEEEKVGDVGAEVTNNIESCESNGVPDEASDEAEKIVPKPKSHSKEKKSKKGSTPSKMTPKGKHSPKVKKDTKAEPEIDTKEKEKLPGKKVEPEDVKVNDSPVHEMQPSVKIVRLSAIQSDSSETNDSVVEVPVEKESIPQSIPSTSSDEAAPKIAEVHPVKDSPRRSTRRSVRHTPPKQKTPEKVESSSVIVLDSDDSISVLEVTRSPQDVSFAQSLRSMSGRPSLRPVGGFNRSLNRPYGGGSVSIRSNVSSRSVTTTSNDSESDSQEIKTVQSKSGIWGLFRSPSRSVPSQDSATDNEESLNLSVADDSGNDSEATTEPFEAASNISFRKRKMQEDDLAEVSQESKKLRADSQQNDRNASGLLSMMTSPMNLFASKLRGDKAKSSTPVQLLKSSDLQNGDENEDAEDANANKDVSEIEYAENNATTLPEKETLGTLTLTADGQAMAPRRWCSVM